MAGAKRDEPFDDRFSEISGRTSKRSGHLHHSHDEGVGETAAQEAAMSRNVRVSTPPTMQEESEKGRVEVGRWATGENRT